MSEGMTVSEYNQAESSKMKILEALSTCLGSASSGVAGNTVHVTVERILDSSKIDKLDEDIKKNNKSYDENRESTSKQNEDIIKILRENNNLGEKILKEEVKAQEKRDEDLFSFAKLLAKNFPIIGNIGNTILKGLEKFYDIQVRNINDYRKIISAGVFYNKDLKQLHIDAASLGIRSDELRDAYIKNSKNIARLTSVTSDGNGSFVKLLRSVKDVSNEIGMNFTDSVEIASYMIKNTFERFDNTSESFNRLSKETQEYQKFLQKLSFATGKSADSIIKEQEARDKEAAYRVWSSDKRNRPIDAFLTSIGASSDLINAFVTGVPNEAFSTQMLNPETGRIIQELMNLNINKNNMTMEDMTHRIGEIMSTKNDVVLDQVRKNPLAVIGNNKTIAENTNLALNLEEWNKNAFLKTLNKEDTERFKTISKAEETVNGAFENTLAALSLDTKEMNRVIESIKPTIDLFNQKMQEFTKYLDGNKILDILNILKIISISVETIITILAAKKGLEWLSKGKIFKGLGKGLKWLGKRASSAFSFKWLKNFKGLGKGASSLLSLYTIEDIFSSFYDISKKGYKDFEKEAILRTKDRGFLGRFFHPGDSLASALAGSDRQIEVLKEYYQNQKNNKEQSIRTDKKQQLEKNINDIENKKSSTINNLVDINSKILRSSLRQESDIRYISTYIKRYDNINKEKSNKKGNILSKYISKLVTPNNKNLDDIFVPESEEHVKKLLELRKEKLNKILDAYNADLEGNYTSKDTYWFDPKTKSYSIGSKYSHDFGGDLSKANEDHGKRIDLMKKLGVTYDTVSEFRDSIQENMKTRDDWHKVYRMFESIKHVNGRIGFAFDEIAKDDVIDFNDLFHLSKGKNNKFKPEEYLKKYFPAMYQIYKLNDPNYDPEKDSDIKLPNSNDVLTVPSHLLQGLQKSSNILSFTPNDVLNMTNASVTPLTSVSNAIQNPQNMISLNQLQPLYNTNDNNNEQRNKIDDLIDSINKLQKSVNDNNEALNGILQNTYETARNTKEIALNGDNLGEQ